MGWISESNTSCWLGSVPSLVHADSRGRLRQNIISHTAFLRYGKPFPATLHPWLKGYLRLSQFYFFLSFLLFHLLLTAFKNFKLQIKYVFALLVTSYKTLGNICNCSDPQVSHLLKKRMRLSTFYCAFQHWYSEPGSKMAQGKDLRCLRACRHSAV